MEIVSRKNTILIISAVLVAFLSLFLIMQFNKLNKTDESLPLTPQEIQKQSNSDEIKDIQKDLENTDLTNIDTELKDIESELNQTL